MNPYRLTASQHRLPGAVLQEVAGVMGGRHEPWLLIGAAARDITIVARVAGLRPVRATHDVDIAVACGSVEVFSALGDQLSPRVGEHTFRVFGVEVDVVPFGGLEEPSGVVRFSDGSELDTVGLEEALVAPHDVILELRDGDEVRIPVVSPESQAVLKLLVWRDRSLSKGPHDAVDLHAILEASSMGPYEDDAWADDVAMEQTEGDILCAGPYRFGRLAAQTFHSDRPERAMAVVAQLVPSFRRTRLIADMGGALAQDRLEAFAAGFTSIWPAS